MLSSSCLLSTIQDLAVCGVFSRILSSSKKLKHFFMVLNQGVLLQFFKGELQGW